MPLIPATPHEQAIGSSPASAGAATSGPARRQAESSSVYGILRSAVKSVAEWTFEDTGQPIRHLLVSGCAAQFPSLRTQLIQNSDSDAIIAGVYWKPNDLIFPLMHKLNTIPLWSRSAAGAHYWMLQDLSRRDIQASSNAIAMMILLTTSLRRVAALKTPARASWPNCPSRGASRWSPGNTGSSEVRKRCWPAMISVCAQDQSTIRGPLHLWRFPYAADERTSVDGRKTNLCWFGVGESPIQCRTISSLRSEMLHHSSRPSHCKTVSGPTLPAVPILLSTLGTDPSKANCRSRMCAQSSPLATSRTFRWSPSLVTFRISRVGG